jgi:hypothetical protein
MTPLRQRVIDDLRLRNYSPRTVEAYVAGVARFARYFNRSPDQLGPDEVRAFQLELLRRRVSWSQFNQTVCALRFFFNITLAISNARLLEVADGKVIFRYKDYAANNEAKTMTLAADEFLRRFTQHILPERFVKIRYVGLLANKKRAIKLTLCRFLLHSEGVPDAFADAAPAEAIIEDAQTPTCPNCGSTRLVNRQLPPARMACLATACCMDSS